MDAMQPDMDHLSQWIGRGEDVADTVTGRLAASLNATLNRPSGRVPLGLHWCLAPDMARTSELAPDGLPARGGFLPPVPLPLRMWAGGRVVLHDGLRIGDDIVRRSKVSGLTMKEGRSGPLCFVSILHEYETARGPAVSERQDIVYRTRPSGPASPPVPDMPDPEHTELVMADPVLLFRYSALTFNGHRIHFDRDYCREEEGHPGLLVHGPLQATFLMNLATDMKEGHMPRIFDYRAIRPLYDGAEFSLNAARNQDGLTVWTADAAGRATLTAEVTW